MYYIVRKYEITMKYIEELYYCKYKEYLLISLINKRRLHNVILLFNFENIYIYIYVFMNTFKNVIIYIL